MKTVHCLILLAMVSLTSSIAEEWRKVAFVGNAKVKTISGLVEVILPEKRILREGEVAKVGDVLRVWRGADLIIQMESSKSLVRAKGPVLLRLAPEKEGFNRASVTGQDEKAGFVVRAVRGGGRFSEDGVHWQTIEAGMILANGAQVRAFRDSILDFYHNRAHTTLRVADHNKRVTLSTPTQVAATGASAMEMASKAP